MGNTIFYVLFYVLLQLHLISWYGLVSNGQLEKKKGHSKKILTFEY